MLNERSTVISIKVHGCPRAALVETHLASKKLRCGSISSKSRKNMANELSGDAELTAQCTATRMFAIHQATALFCALAEKKLIDPQHVFATNEALALGFEQMAANI
jgi:hypothetical protein